LWRTAICLPHLHCALVELICRRCATKRLRLLHDAQTTPIGWGHTHVTNLMNSVLSPLLVPGLEPEKLRGKPPVRIYIGKI
jgi:hypothetical protein